MYTDRGDIRVRQVATAARSMALTHVTSACAGFAESERGAEMLRFDYTPLQPGDAGFIVHCGFRRCAAHSAAL